MEFETYEDVIDAFENGVGVIQGESLTDYIKRNNIKIKQLNMDPLGDLKKIIDAKDGGAIGIEVLFKKKDGGSINSPKSKNIKGQDHMLAYITPNEAKKLEALGGKETMTKEGIPAYPEWDSMYGASSKASFDKGIAPKGNVNWSGGGNGGNNNPPIIINKPPVIPKDDKVEQNLTTGKWMTNADLATKQKFLNYLNQNKSFNLGQDVDADTLYANYLAATGLDKHNKNVLVDSETINKRKEVDGNTIFDTWTSDNTFKDLDKDWITRSTTVQDTAGNTTTNRLTPTGMWENDVYLGNRGPQSMAIDPPKSFDLPGNDLRAEVTEKQKQTIEDKMNMLNRGLIDTKTVYDNTKIFDNKGSTGFWGMGKEDPNPMTPKEFNQELIDQGYKGKDFIPEETMTGKDGGRVGFQSGGWAEGLTGEAKGIYDSMTAYGASDAEIQSKLQTQGLWSPDGSGSANTGQVTGIINQNIGGRDNTYPGQVVDQTDYSFNKKNYAPGGKLEINPEAIGMSFYDSEPGGKKDQGFIESFMGAAVPSKQFSQFTSPGTGDVLKGPAELGFMSQQIEGIPGNLTREDLRSMYDNYNKFTGRGSNYQMARVPGSAENLLGLAFSGMSGIPGVTQLGEFLGSQGDKSMQSKYSVDNAGYGQGTSRDEFGTYTGGKTLMGKTNNYIERMEDKISDLTDFFSERIEDFDPDNIDDDMIDEMNKYNGFYTKQFQAYKNRLATEKINSDFAKKQAEIEAAKRAAEIQATQSRIDRSETDINKAAAGNDSPSGASTVNPNSAYGKAQGYTGGNPNPHTATGWSGSSKKKAQGGLISYNRGGLATMFTRRR